MVNLTEILQDIFRTNQLTSEIIASVIIFSLTVLIGGFAYYLFGRYFSRWAKQTKTTLGNELLRNIKPAVLSLIMLAGFYYALGSTTFMAAYSEQLSALFTVLEIILIAFAIAQATTVLAAWYVSRHTENHTVKNNHILFLLKKLAQLFVCIIALLAILAVFRVDLSGVVVGLGVGAVAIAFAVQSTLSDVISAFSIYFDRPFEIGDFIVVGEHSGIVTNIGVKSTRIKLLQGEELVISNKELTSTRVRNFRKLERRRVTFTIGVAYSTPLAKLKKIPQIMSHIISSVELAELDRVNFTEFGDYSLKFLVAYYIRVADYGKYMDTRETINFAIKEAFEKEGIEIAFPTQTVYMNK